MKDVGGMGDEEPWKGKSRGCGIWWRCGGMDNKGCGVGSGVLAVLKSGFVGDVGG